MIAEIALATVQNMYVNKSGGTRVTLSAIGAKWGIFEFYFHGSLDGLNMGDTVKGTVEYKGVNRGRGFYLEAEHVTLQKVKLSEAK